MKRKMKQANRNAMPMLFVWRTRNVNLLCVLPRTFKISNVLICGQWSQSRKSQCMWLAKSAILQSDYKKKKSVCDEKNCQSNKFTKPLCHDKNCQSTQCIHMCTAMKSSYIWSVTKPSHMQLPKPAMKQSTYKTFLKDDKTCQFTKKHSSEECTVTPVWW